MNQNTNEQKTIPHFISMQDEEIRDIPFKCDPILIFSILVFDWVKKESDRSLEKDEMIR